jgi:hypothetical protein
MKKSFTPDHFEHFLKDSADDLQMRPTNAVWRRIQGRLNRRRRWTLFTSAFFLVTASLFGYFIVDRAKEPSDPFAGVQTLPEEKNITPENTTAAAAPSQPMPVSSQTKAAGSFTKTQVAPQPVDRTLTATAQQLFQNPIPEPLVAAVPFTPVPVDEHQPFAGAASRQPVAEQALANNSLLTIESVVNLYKPKLKRRTSEFQMYFTPTVSYRRLTENKSYLRAVPQNLASFNMAALYDVNSLVTHKPDLGLELGVGFKFPVARSIKLRTGLQFNVNRYDIKAFTYVPERATITLNNGPRGVDSLNTISRHRNFSGGRMDWIQNLYYQISAPIGVEVNLSGSRRTKIGIATTIQPTYVLGDRAYLLSADYKNYSQVPWLMRRWNVNTSLETFVAYKTGTVQWQVGPQVRYQLLSSFVEKYPVKENLFDFGVKVGVSLSKQ